MPRRAEAGLTQEDADAEQAKTLFPAFAISWPGPLISEFPLDVHNSIWQRQKKPKHDKNKRQGTRPR